VHQIVSRLAALVVLFSLIALPPAQPVSAQTFPSAEAAIRQTVADVRGVDPAVLIVNITDETGEWAYGSATVPAGPDDHAPLVSYALAHIDGGWIAELRYTDAFNALLRQAPSDFPNPAVRAALDGINLAGDGSADLSFPFPVGERWRFNGPHPNSPEPGRVWSSLDFYRISAGGIDYNAPITAMRGGVVSRPCANLVEIDHGDGWSTSYYHVVNIAVTQGQVVTRGQLVGGTSAEFRCGGAADGPHSHIWTSYNGVEMPIHGTDIGGWTVSNGAAPYQGCLTRGSEVLCRENFDSVTNDGTSGSAASVSIAPIRSTVNNWITYQINGMPANTTGDVRWRRLSGSTFSVGTFATNNSGRASGTFRVPATPGGPDQLVSFVAGGMTLTATFDVAPRIKVVTSPGQRGGVVDVSLRGYAKQEVVRIRWYRPNVGWVQLATLTTSNTGSANISMAVPNWAPDGANKVRGDGTVFRQQTNAAMISGGAPLQTADEAVETPTPAGDATPAAEAPQVVLPEDTVAPTEPPLTIDRSALPPDAPRFTGGEPGWSIDQATGAVVATVDTGGLHTIRTVGWLSLDPACAVFERVEVSSDGIAWLPLPPPNAPVPGVWQALTVDSEARWIRWVSSTGDPATVTGCLAEIAIWAAPVIEDPAALADSANGEETGTPVPASTERVDG
jgi:murein DD-endopeptidase MepM/ murein hydrolase activator NlpD